MKSKASVKSFVAVDFETANRYRNSACAIGLVRVERGRIVRRAYRLIRPPFRVFEFTHIHGIEWNDVRRAPTFADLVPEILSFLRGAAFIAAHNAPFDRGVWEATSAWHGIALPAIPFECTLKIARSWGLKPATLRHVADYLGLSLNHHHAGSDAEACARIVLAAAA